MESDIKPRHTGLIIGIIIAIIVLAIGIGVGIWLYERKKKHELVVITPSKQKYKGIWSKWVDTYDKGQSQDNAPAYCTNNTSQIASKTQMDAAYKATPFDFCRGGWMDDKSNPSGYYMKTLNQKDCGNNATGFISILPPDSGAGKGKLGVYCYGYPPDDLSTGKDLWLPDQIPS